jgi:hypothetical protein
MVTHSAFPYESMSGFWKRDHHGSKYYPKAALINFCNRLQLNFDERKETPSVNLICPPLLYQSQKLSPRLTNLRAIELVNIFRGGEGEKTMLSYSLITGPEIYETQQHSEFKTTADCHICWQQGEVDHFGTIQQIVVTQKPPKQLYFVVLEATEKLHSFNHIFVFSSQSSTTVLEVVNRDIQKVFGTQMGKKKFYSKILEKCSW